MIADSKARFTALQRRPFWFPKTVESDVEFDSIVNVECFDATVRVEIIEPEKKPSKLQFVTVNAEALSQLPKCYLVPDWIICSVVGRRSRPSIPP